LAEVVADLSRAAVRLDQLAAWLTASGFALRDPDDSAGRVPPTIVPVAIHRVVDAAGAVRGAVGVIGPFAAPEDVKSSLARLRLS